MKEKTPQYSSFFISYVDHKTVSFQGYDLERKKYVVTSGDWAIYYDLIKKYGKEYNITEKDSVSLVYEYFDSKDSINLKPMNLK
jgi:hypothetical protein